MVRGEVDDPAPFGALLVRYRAAAGLTQEQLAASAGMSVDAVAALERGRRRTPRPSTAFTLADALRLNEADRAKFLAATRPVSGHTVRRDGDAASRTALSLLPRLVQPTPLVGRTTELEIIHQSLIINGVRLLTIVGPAGVGKTRLALEATGRLTDDFAGRIIWVDLVPLLDPQLVLPTIARELGVTNQGQTISPDTLRDVVGDRAQLVVLDNFDVVLPAGAMFADVLATCPALTLLVTSRVPLHLRWEQLLRLAPLPIPDPDAAVPPLEVLAEIPSVALFVARAHARRADFVLTEERAPLVARLVAGLDGLPLALELAAARLDVLPLATIVDRLQDRLQLLRWEAQDLPERQRSLEAAIGWSFDLLSAEEQQLFRHLGVFLGQVVLDAIQAVQDSVFRVARAVTRPRVSRTLGDLASLAEKSLILPGRDDDDTDAEGKIAEEATGGPSFGILETMREYAWEQLAQRGELTAARQAHAHYFLDLAERADPQLRRVGQRGWFLRLEHERDNLRAALRWLLDQEAPEERAAALRLATALGYFWRCLGWLAEGARWLEEGLQKVATADAGSDLGLRARALLQMGYILMEQGMLARAQATLEEALSLAEQQHDAVTVAMTLTGLGAQAVFAGDTARSSRLLEDALHRSKELEDDPHHVGATLLFQANAAMLRGDVEHAGMLASQADAQFNVLGDERLLGSVHLLLALVAQARAQLPSSTLHVLRGLDISERFQDRWLLSIGVRFELAVLADQVAPAHHAELLGAADALGQASGAPMGMWERLVVDPGTAKLREGLARGEYADAYRAGRSMGFAAVVSLARQLLEQFERSLGSADVGVQPVERKPTRAEETPHADVLSPREREVLRLVAQGLSSKAIGRRLFISERTVAQHLTAVFHKLGVNTRAQAVAVAVQRGLL